LSASLFQSSSFTEVFAFLLTPEGGLRIFAMSQLEKPSYVAEALGFLPPLLTMDYAPRRSAAKATITEILAADLGDATSRSPHLIVSRSGNIVFSLLTSAGPNIQRRSRHLQSVPLAVPIPIRAVD
jgi:cleavage and polyadenylation specificity factor subunit 1